jgi:CHAT domain-containing protein
MNELSNAVLPAQLRRDLGPFQRLIILPSGDVSELSFLALPFDEDGTPVGAHFAVVIAPDLEALAVSRTASSRREFHRVAIFADPELRGHSDWILPPLPGARLEADSVRKVFPHASIYEGPTATRSAALGEMGRADLLYFATHAASSARDPMDSSFVALAGGFLYGRTIRDDSRVRAIQPLVVLSACESGLGKKFSGGVFGPTRAWYYAGASQVVASLWSVDDSATNALMSDFSAGIASGAGAEWSLRDAVRSAWQRSLGDAALWSAFYVFGLPSAAAAPATTELPTVEKRDVAFRRAGIEKIVADHGLDALDRDLLYLRSRSMTVDSLVSRYPWLSRAQLAALKRATSSPPSP